MSGWMPISRSALTECWVGLVLSSPEASMKGTSVRWTNAALSRPSSWRIWRMASRKGSDSMSPTVPPTSTITTSTSFETLNGVLDFARDVGDHLDGLAQVVAAALLGDDALIDAPR